MMESVSAQSSVFVASARKSGSGNINKWPCEEVPQDTINLIENYWQEVQFVPPYDYCGKIAVCFQIDTIHNLIDGTDTLVAIVDIPFQLNDSVYNFMQYVTTPDSGFGVKILPKDHLGNSLDLISVVDLSSRTKVAPDSSGFYQIAKLAPHKTWEGFPRLVIDITNFTAPSMVINIDFLLGYRPQFNSYSYTQLFSPQEVMAGPPCLFNDPTNGNSDNNLRVSRSSSNRLTNPIISPNPVENHLSIKFQENISQILSIELFDLNGKMIFTKQFLSLENNNSITLHLSELSEIKSGLLILKIQGENFLETYKVIKL